MSESLKPCPFCGGVRVRIQTDRVTAGHGCYVTEHYAECVECNCRTDSFDTYGDTDEAARAKAITAWNMRVFFGPSYEDLKAKVENQRKSLHGSQKALCRALNHHLSFKNKAEWADYRESHTAWEMSVLQQAHKELQERYDALRVLTAAREKL